MQLLTLGRSKMEISKTDFFYILTVEIPYVKRVLGSVCESRLSPSINRAVQEERPSIPENASTEQRLQARIDGLESYILKKAKCTEAHVFRAIQLRQELEALAKLVAGGDVWCRLNILDDLPMLDSWATHALGLGRNDLIGRLPEMKQHLNHVAHPPQSVPLTLHAAEGLH